MSDNGIKTLTFTDQAWEDAERIRRKTGHSTKAELALASFRLAELIFSNLNCLRHICSLDKNALQRLNETVFVRFEGEQAAKELDLSEFFPSLAQQNAESTSDK